MSLLRLAPDTRRTTTTRPPAHPACRPGPIASPHLHRAKLGGERAADAAGEDDGRDDGRELARQRQRQHAAHRAREAELGKLAHKLGGGKGRAA